MANNSVKIELDQASLNNLNKQFEHLKTTVAEASPLAIFAVLTRIKETARLRLTGRGHVKSSRLKNSIHVQMNKFKDTDNATTYKDDNGKSYASELRTVKLTDFEGAVGTNVEYASAVEFGARPHTIEAKNFPVLGNKEVGFFGKKVNHPGFAGDSFLYWATKNVDISKKMQDEMTNALKFGKYATGTKPKGARTLTNAD